MRTFIALSSLGLTLALGVGSAALAAPGGSAVEQNRNHYLHKKYYRLDQDRARGERSGTIHLRDPDALGAASPDGRKPLVRPEPMVRG
jgi:hypothetical protein